MFTVVKGTKMDVRLNAHVEQLLREQLAKGHFHSAQEVIERVRDSR